jgi:TPP-dependent pyruvate/acetoin dehydrogenase alpha subunit
MTVEQSEELYDKLFRRALLIRRIEEKVIEIYPTDQIQSPVHLSIGQEAVSVGLCEALRPGDLAYGSYRSHALYVALGGDLTAMFAELMGRIGGVSKGKAGSMHLTWPEGGFMGSSAVVASHLPHAVGSALAAQQRKTGQVIACVFGDGALEEGVAHESFNYAALTGLPVLFLCENNSLAVHSHIQARHAFTIEALAGLYGFPYERVDRGWDFLEVHRACDRAVAQIRAGGGPRFLEVATFRYKEHVGTQDDFHYGYRSPEAYEEWRANDPLAQDGAALARLSAAVDAEIETAVAAALLSPAPGIEELLTDVR